MATHPVRSRTIDRGPPGGGPPLSGSVSEPLEVGSIGPNRSLLPDGSLLCRNVPIARAGWMNYAEGEVPLKPPTTPGAAPIIYVHRGPEDLFNEETMRSFVGVAVTHEHPPVPVTPQNFAHLGKGFVLRVFRGEGPDSDCLMADLIVKDKWLIEQIESGKREVSCGYEATYDQTGDGQGRQRNIIGNHLALVEAGRCGPRCAIGDEDTLSTTVNEDLMTTQNQGAPKRQRVPLTELRARVADTLGMLDAATEEQEQNGVHVHVHMGGQQPQAQEPGGATPPEGKEGEAAPTMDKAVEDRFANIEKGQEELKGTLATILEAVQRGGQAAPQAGAQGQEDPEVITEATATMDSAPLATSYQAFLSQAEILVPGFKLPTFDAAAQRKLTVDRMCQGRRMVLGAYQATKDGAAALGSLDVLGADCPTIAKAFKEAAAAKAAANNRASTGDSNTLPQQQQAQPQKRTSFADINKQNADFWKTQGPRA